MKKRSGKKLENLVKLIQEALKDLPQTKIFQNYKIDNKGGRSSAFGTKLLTVNSF